MGYLALTLAKDEPLVLYTSDGPVIVHSRRGRRGELRHVESRILAPPSVRVLRGNLVSMDDFVDHCASIQAMQDAAAARKDGAA